ncbi:hypothetical protein AB2L28_19570 [Kineococcus sp. TBRC 1896]|uniref:Secreted protein n=1 Tax=Kineococcus mangrovi TaxID=1660183 RepID=A0ABV4I9P6_9ACTN
MDENTAPRRRGRLLAAGIAGAAALGLAVAGPAAADTADSTATAATLSLLGAPALSSGPVTANSDGTTTSTSGDPTPSLSLLGTQNLITAGVLVQRATATPLGTSAACAGLVGSGGSLTIGADGRCVVAPGTGQGVQIVLAGGLTPTVLKADAIVASCSAAAGGTPTAGVRLVNAKVHRGAAVTATLADHAAPGTTVSVPLVATLKLNSLGNPTPDGVSTSALDLSLVGSLTTLSVGAVTCGPNARTVPTDALPGPALPLAAAALVAVGLRLRRPVLQILDVKGTHRG